MGLDNISSVEMTKLKKLIVKEVESRLVLAGLDFSKGPSINPDFNYADLLIAQALTKGEEKVSSVRDFYQRPFHGKMSLFPERKHFY